ncbi:NAD-dependent epimerase [Cellulomonas chitinilytica]|uniref:NAD-dependent epimerase n=1 Tax=Cellulomonas chitinilytica TaxID=398759 RepID=A0A919U0H2_9CELL|nr:NAD-dependent epimerase/dehydratase family protein [Cellulomonas chitinilytica]GIG22865.1 NAD-dependent epimerase [Cellulomonas chitinilytica]
MARHVVLGKGAVGSTLVNVLAGRGESVLVVSRSGRPAAGSDVEHAAVDVADGAALARAARGADVIYNCVNPPYHRWVSDWPALISGALDAAAATGAVLVTAGNLYGYGTHGAVMTEDLPLRATESKGAARAAVWHEAERRHRLGELRATEVRAGDYLGPLADSQAHAGPRFLDPLLAGKVVRTVVAVDQPHSWTYLPDFAHAMVAAGATAEAWGSAWHVPTAEPLTFRELAGRFAAAAGAPEPRMRPVPPAALRALGLVSPLIREIAAVSDHFSAPFVMSTEASQKVLGTTATPWSVAVTDTLAARAASRATV